MFWSMRLARLEYIPDLLLSVMSFSILLCSVYFVRGLKLLFDAQRQTGYLFIHSFSITGSTCRPVY